jgi:hypothetical protein
MSEKPKGQISGAQIGAIIAAINLIGLPLGIGFLTLVV